MKSSKPKPSRKKLLIIASICTTLVILAIWLAFVSSQTPADGTNYAKDVARPLEGALSRAGAAKVCDTGDSGRGADNRTPWYTVYLESSKNREAAESLIVDVARANGFSVQRAAEGTKGYLGDAVYEDKSKVSTNTDLKDGSVDLAIALTNSGALHACKDDVTNDAEHTAITLELRLPEYK